MTLKVFVADINNNESKKSHTPLLYAFFKKEALPDPANRPSNTPLHNIEYVSSIEACHIATTALYIESYMAKGKLILPANLNEQARQYGKLMVLFTRGDYGFTPPPRNGQYGHYHLYRMGGYASKNKGNQWVFPNFIEDPIKKFFNNQLPLFQHKTLKPLVGFCGQGDITPTKIAIDIGRGLLRLAKRKLLLSYHDPEVIESTTHTRSKLLDAFEQSSLTDTQFIRHRKYRGGDWGKHADAKKISTRFFYENMALTQYNVCYRGNGNFSVRLYETLACGRIPIIVLSDNNLPFPEIINWQQFPVIEKNERKKIAEIVAAFHSSLSEEAFARLQLSARKVWENHLSYDGFMNTFVIKYAALPGL